MMTNRSESMQSELDNMKRHQYNYSVAFDQFEKKEAHLFPMLDNNMRKSFFKPLIKVSKKRRT